jgi:hypothetical protein
LAHGLSSRVWRRGGHSDDGNRDFAKARARDHSPEHAAQLSGRDAAGFRHFRDGNEPILSRPDQDQA